jgi:hypothetical protein
MNIAGLLFLLLTQFISGRGFVKLFRVQLPIVALACLSMICGVMLVSFVPCLLQIMHIPLTVSSMYVGIGILTAMMAVPQLLKFKDIKLPSPKWPQLYEIPFYLVFLALIITSVWRCYYFPPTPRDVLTGTELIAEYAVREHTMLNSALSVDLRLNGAANNIFKSPFITSLQIVYKFLVQPFGEVWLSVLFVSFTIWFYSMLRQRVHPVIAGTLMLILLATPDLFAYTYIILYDYPNMIYFFAGFFFFLRYMENEKLNDLAMVTTMFGFATYLRNETLVMVAAIALPFAWTLFKRKTPVKDIAIRGLILMSGAIFFNFVVAKLFMKAFIPVPFSLGELINKDWMNLSGIIEKNIAICSELIFTPKGMQVYGQFFYFFLSVFAVDLVITRKLNFEARWCLWFIVIVYFCLGTLSHLIPSHTIMNSAKRGLFKILPLMTLYLANTGLLKRLSDFITNRENKIHAASGQPKVATQPAPKGGRGKVSR